MSSENEIQSVRKWTSYLWQRAVLFGVAYFICAEAGSYLSPRDTTYVSFWMPAGLSVAVLLLNATRDWPWLLLAMMPANLIFDFFHGTKLEVAFLFYCANAVQAFLGAWLMRRFVAERPAMRTVKEFVSLLAFGVSFSTMAGAIIGAATLVHFGFSNSFRQSWIVWWDSTAMAVLVLTPFILTWFSSPKEIRRVFNSGKKILEAALLLAGFSLAIWYLLVLDKGVMSPSKFMVIPFLLWAALRFGVHGATASVLFTALVLSFFTTQFFLGLTPAQISSGEYIFVLQMVSAMGSLIAVTPAVVLAERDQSLVELRESEERFKNLSAAAFEGVCISENGEILDVNHQFLKMFGYDKRDEVIGKQIIEMVVPEMRAKVNAAIQSEHEEIYGHRLLRKDGSSFFAEARARMARVGNRTLRMTALRDISERKQAEDLTEIQIQVLEMITTGKPMLKTLDVLLRMIEMQLPDMLCSILLLDADGIHIRHGAAPSLPPDYLKAIDGDAIGPCAGSCGTAAFRREPVYVSDIATDPLWKDYKRVALLHGLHACWSTPILDGQRNVLGTFAIYYRKTGLPNAWHGRLIDVATRNAAVCIAKHRTDAALRESEEKFSKAFRTSPDVMSITDFENGKYLEVNDAHEKTFGFTREEVIGRSPTELGIYQDVSRREEMIQMLKDKGRFSNFEIKARTRTGREVTLLHSAELIELDGRLCVLRVSHDITEREEAVTREQQARLDYTLKFIASQEAERARIAAELHDSLGQNLLLIKNYAQVALANKEINDAIYQQVEAISGLATQSIAEARSISYDLHPHQINYLGLTRALNAMIDKAAQSTGIIFQRKFDNVDDIFSKDAAMNLYRIVQEILNNILKHSHAGNASIKLERDVHEVQLTITDDGCGFDAKKNGEGMGLKNIAERSRILGGEWKVDSAAGKGTRIEINIPISAEAE